MKRKLYRAAVASTIVIGIGLCVGGAFCPVLLIPGGSILGTVLAMGLKEIKDSVKSDPTSPVSEVIKQDKSNVESRGYRTKVKPSMIFFSNNRALQPSIRSKTEPVRLKP